MIALLAVNARRNRRVAFIGAVLSVAALSAALVKAALGDAVAYFYTPSDLAKLAEPPHGLIRLGGLVETGSVSHDVDTASVHFIVKDRDEKTAVAYRGLLPDLFREGQGVVVQGRLVGGELQAFEVLAKHDEKYMPREVADALKKQGAWKEQAPAP